MIRFRPRHPGPPHNLLYFSYLCDETLDRVRADIDEWHAPPAAE
ncbi:hypothetical protein ACLMAJ_23370 [Nocardia sp. KC 131]